MALLTTSFVIPSRFTPAGLCRRKVSRESQIHIAVCSGLMIKKWVQMIQQEILDINNAGVIHSETLAVGSKFSHLKPPFHISESLRRQAAALTAVRTTGFPEVITVSSTPRTQLPCPRRWTALSAAPSSWLYSAPRGPASSATACCRKTWPIR